LKMKLIQMREWKKRSSVELKLEKLIDILDDLQDRMDKMETRQLQLVRAISELVDRLKIED